MFDWSTNPTLENLVATLLKRASHRRTGRNREEELAISSGTPTELERAVPRLPI